MTSSLYIGRLTRLRYLELISRASFVLNAISLSLYQKEQLNDIVGEFLLLLSCGGNAKRVNGLLVLLKERVMYYDTLYYVALVMHVTVYVGDMSPINHHWLVIKDDTCCYKLA
uniref:Uncharacterized protein n=1 Tax=Onchocerca volvulus TaxID=6282 RepID=A0A2K6VL60_ONCVO